MKSKSLHGLCMDFFGGLKMSLFIALVFSIFVPTLGSATVRVSSQQAMAQSNMRQAALAFNYYAFSGARTRYHPDDFQNMQDLLKAFAKVDLMDASLFLSHNDLGYTDKKVPWIIGSISDAGERVFVPDILEFPIGFSFAVYPDLGADRPASTTPLLWTRGLHRYESFDQPYAGYVAFLDGHVTYVAGEPGKPDPMIEQIFGPASEFAAAIRVLEHEPEDWVEEKVAPLPVRYAQAASGNFSRRFTMLATMCAPAAIAGFLAALLPKPSIRQRLWSGLIAFGIVLIATLILVPAV